MTAGYPAYNGGGQPVKRAQAKKRPGQATEQMSEIDEPIDVLASSVVHQATGQVFSTTIMPFARLNSRLLGRGLTERLNAVGPSRTGEQRSAMLQVVIQKPLTTAAPN